ncbi:hypothetical protein WR25_13655 [Diploscapter pachys]|uniref:CS domain-containing protein n=1 Tax=Diploscapter pachys TaxID=2018661 RepID=A0A2A2KRK4_9BILA|nr:hypothetical protein WR25_13655 [Diploscapter pachys]
MAGALVQCYNKGCGKKFSPDENDAESCCYHPGPPYFHDAYKIWNCCNKKSTDFGTWLAYPGCTRGKHSNVKPEDVVRVSAVKEIRPEKEDEVIVWNGLNKPAERKPDEAREEVPIKITVNPSAKAAVDSYREQHSSAETSDELKIGTPCRNNSCSQAYAGPETFTTPCTHHPGQAIFHEGIKYWSCCQKKTTNFGAFLEQPGCETGTHKFSRSEKVDKVREDHFCANGMVTINVYCKGAVYDQVEVKSDGQLLRAKIVHAFGDKESNLVYDLYGEVIPDESEIVISERKVELKLKQQTPKSWPRLQYDETMS